MRDKIFQFARWLVMLIAPCVLVMQTAGAQVVDHAFSFDTRYDNQDGVVLDYRYGESKLPVRAPEDSVREGKPLTATNVNGPMLRGDFLYVKWRNKTSGLVYEDKVDLRQRLPSDITDYRIHFEVKGAQLYVYLVSPKTRPADVPPNGPSMYKRRIVTTIYPD
jgi:hypothetical protein